MNSKPKWDCIRRSLMLFNTESLHLPCSVCYPETGYGRRGKEMVYADWIKPYAREVYYE